MYIKIIQTIIILSLNIIILHFFLNNHVRRKLIIIILLGLSLLLIKMNISFFEIYFNTKQIRFVLFISLFLSCFDYVLILFKRVSQNFIKNFRLAVSLKTLNIFYICCIAVLGTNLQLLAIWSSEFLKKLSI